MKFKFRILSIICIIIMLTSANASAYENIDNRTYNIRTKITLENVKSNNFIIRHSFQREFDSYGIRYLKESIEDKDINKVTLNNHTANLEYNYSNKNVFLDSRILEIENVPCSRILLKHSDRPYDSDKLKDYSNLDGYLQTNEDKQLIENISKNIVGNEQIPYIKAQLIYQYINTKFQYDENQHNGDFKETIKSGKGVCSDFSELFIILARYNNIPTRLVVGLRVKPENITNDYKDFSDRKHAWVEFYIENFGWLMADPTTYTEKDINNADRGVNWDGFVNDKNKDHIPLAYNIWENISVQYFGECEPFNTKVQYYIKNANSETK
ncbi:transglutaminase-like domain-containing protein [Clostridium tagluense]|uniref:transglutaminase-like domain-containing protein n=1 Tax=Clostridium tagluense TaxID=360422 RepID=UPI001C0E0A64|nr:transglutaminase-like domain-containing protein [Clostridium tagluense]MBU3126736.1 transglutaminase-like domain-containing protein [Clostridium tagluense]